MLSIEEYTEMVKKDLEIDPELLDVESLKTSTLHGKYISFLIAHSKRLRASQRDKKKLVRELTEYYSGRAEKDVYDRKGDFSLKILKPDMEMYIESDTEYLELQRRIDEDEEIIKFLESTVRHINGRNYAIKNAIDWRRFSNGLN